METRPQGISDGSAEKKRGGLGRVFREEFGNPERRTAYLMILPTMLIIALVAFYPIAVSIYYSFRLDIPGAEGTWAGLRNYLIMFQDTSFQSALVNTTIFTVVSVFFEFILGLAIALAVITVVITVFSGRLRKLD